MMKGEQQKVEDAVGDLMMMLHDSWPEYCVCFSCVQMRGQIARIKFYGDKLCPKPFNASR